MMTNTNNPIVSNATSGPFAGSYEATDMVIFVDGGRFPRLVCIPTAEAMKWDGAGEGTTHTIFLDNLGVHCYAEIKITGRAPRKHTGGIFGTTARVRFTGDDVSEGTEWCSAVVAPLGAW